MPRAEIPVANDVMSLSGGESSSLPEQRADRVDTVLNVKSKNIFRMNRLDHKVSQILEHPGLRLVIFS